MNVFAYTVRAELNNDGSYRVILFNVDDDEAPIETLIERAKITIECLEGSCGDDDRPLLSVEKRSVYE